MTGEKNRFTTTEKLWRLDDETLSTPKHDEIVLWLLNPENILKIFPEYKDINTNYFHLYYNKTEMDIDVAYKIYNYMQHKETMDRFMAAYLQYSSFYDQNDILKTIKIESEVPITAPNGFLVGYSDIVIKLPLIAFPEWGGYDKPQIVYSDPKYEVLRPTPYSEYWFSKPKYIEVKPKITSFGTTLRQLKTYQHYLNTDQMYICTPDLGFKAAFESQGIKVIEYKPGI